MSRRLIPKANRTERSIELLFLFITLFIQPWWSPVCNAGWPVFFKHSAGNLCGLQTSMLPLPCICRQVCYMTKMETKLWTWLLGISSCMAVHKSSPCSFPQRSCVLLSQVMQIIWCKKTWHCCLVARKIQSLQSWKNLREEVIESNKLRTPSLYSSPKLCLKGLC